MYGLSTLMGTRCSTASIFAIGIRDSANMITATGSMVAADGGKMRILKSHFDPHTLIAGPPARPSGPT